MKKHFKILILVLLNSTIIYAQKYELGKVTIEELQEKKHLKDTAAVAAFLFEKGETHFDYSEDKGFYVVTDVVAKIKIYKKEGYDWANKSVRYYVGGNDKETVSFSKAISYNLVDGKIEKTKIKSEGEFIENVNKYWSKKKIAMPNVKEGTIIEYSYTIKSPFISNLVDWNFQKVIPVNYSQYSSSIPEYFVYSPHLKGALSPIITSDKRTRSIDFMQKERGVGRNVSNTTFTTSKVEYQEIKNSYTLIDIPALNEEGFVNNIDNYTSSIGNELISIQYPNQPYNNFATTWEDVSKKIFQSEDFGSQLSKDNYYENEINTLTKGLSSDEEKMMTIFSYVKSRMNWNNFYGIYSDVGVKKAYQDKTGNTAEINLMLISMLRFAGLDANPILLSTRFNGVSLYPSRTAFNTVIAGVKTGNSMTFLDATSKNALPNILPNEDLNWFGRLIKKDGASELIELMPTFNSANTINYIVNLDSNGQLEGQLREQYFDYYAFNFRENSLPLSKDAYLEKKENKHPGLEIENYERSNEEDLGEPIVEKYNLKYKNAADIIGDKMYFSPLFYHALKENPFKQELREYPVDFSFPTRDKYMINVSIPEGYKIESIPEAISLAMPNNYATFKYDITPNENKIQVAVSLNINSAIIPPDEYESLKEFFKKVIEKETEKIILKKI